MLKPGVDTSLEKKKQAWTPVLKKNNVREWADQAVLCLVDRVHIK